MYFLCLLIRKMKISISFGDVFDRICHRKRLSIRKVLVFLLLRHFSSSLFFCNYDFSKKYAENGSKYRSISCPNSVLNLISIENSLFRFVIFGRKRSDKVERGDLRSYFPEKYFVKLYSLESLFVHSRNQNEKIQKN